MIYFLWMEVDAMISATQHINLMAKLQRFEAMLNPYLFTKIQSLPVSAYVTDERLHSVPQAEKFESVTSGWKWGYSGAYCWIRSEYTVPTELEGRDIFVMPKMGGYEAMLWVNGTPFGTFNTKIVYTSHGNHYCGLIKKKAASNEKISIALEYYAGHPYYGCNPFSKDRPQMNNYDFSFDSLDICIKNDWLCDFYFDLKTVNQLAYDLPDDSFMRAMAFNALVEVHKNIYYSLEDTCEEEFFEGIRRAHPYLKRVLSQKNGDSAPVAGIIGHSHMDTAWLWHVGETVKKCARTFSNQLSLMDQYPEHRFIQSSALHGDMMRRYYPELFERIRKKAAEGSYEPNGAVWVECDCNITSGESLIRQFLWGQRFTQKYYNFRSNAFWLPDTFGYSASIPQIMKGCSVDYFLTTKISWNDTNSFPLNTFYWQGIDGTKVFTHFNTIQSWPDVKELRGCFIGHHDKEQHTVTNRRLLTYGYGDGGGGPQFEMLEMARRCVDLCEVPKIRYTTVSDFMKELEDTCHSPDTYRGELYLEMHRGTLTNQHEIKYNNRKAEFALRDLEYLTVCESVGRLEPCTTEKTNPLYETLLINQFHDILPGTCINRAHEECKAQMRELLARAGGMIKEMTEGNEDCISVTNTLSFERNDVIFANDTKREIEGVFQQQYTDIGGVHKRLIQGVSIPGFSSVTLGYGKGLRTDVAPFTYSSNTLITPFARVEFDENGFISSFVDTTAGRCLVEGLPLNTFLMAEDVPMNWDNWDIDPDLEMKFKPCATLLERRVVSEGDLAFIIRSKYRLSEKSAVTQDMIFFASTPEVRFDTYMDWQDDHRFLKVAFDTNVREDFARNEIQFGYCKRPTTRNNSLEKAKFEVSNHKYTDLSEPNYGVALLNDCKYGISVNGSRLHLSLHKGGVHPDIKGDKGLHRVQYSFLPHSNAFGAASVIRPAYMLNVPCLVSKGKFEALPLAKADKPNIIVESVKPCEDGERAYIVRFYEGEGTRTLCNISLWEGVSEYAFTNMLEEPLCEVKKGNSFQMELRPFEIVTLKAYY